MSILLFVGMGVTTATLAQTLYGPSVWGCETNGDATQNSSTQQQTLQNWLSQFGGGGQIVSTGACGQLGTTNYAFCPVCCVYGGPGALDVFLLCPDGNLQIF
jgi:hypothetical protein